MLSIKRINLNLNKNKAVLLGKVLMIMGGVGFFIGVGLLSITFFPVVKEEIKYSLTPAQSRTVRSSIVAVDPEFGIIIPKIGANTAVVANVDPFNEKEYQQALTRGVAQARGSVFPGQIGNTFIFAHSAGNWYTANRYNAVFYLLSKLSKGDEIYTSYHKTIYKYKVKDTKQVNSTDVNYLNGASKGKTLTLMTCWPPGTTLNRLIVRADMVE